MERAVGNGKTRGQCTHDGAADHRLACTRFTDDAEDATRRQVEGQPPDHLDVPSAKRGADGEIRRFEDGQALLAAPRRTSSVRRNPSPSRLKPVTVRKIAAIGTSNVHGACAKLVRASAIICPQAA